MNLFLGKFIFYFGLFFLILMEIKLVLVATRIKRGKWPMSVYYLWNIIEWKKEAFKILGLAAAVTLLSLVSMYGYINT